MPLQLRQTNGDGRLFSPDRDLAYCTPHLVFRALRGLDPDNQEAWILGYLAKEYVTNDELVQVAKAVAEYMNKAVFDPAYTEPYAALKASGFFDVRMAAQMAVCAKIGQVFLSAFFVSIRDATNDHEKPPLNMKLFRQEADKLLADLQKHSRPPWYRRFYAGWKRFWGGLCATSAKLVP